MAQPSSPPRTARGARTRSHLLEAALDLFEQYGYDGTTAAQIAGAVGVTEMTFFRHFPTKADVLLDDPYDPLIADAVAAQPRELPVLLRVTGGLRDATQALPPGDMASMRRRLRVAAATPSLAAALRANTARTESVVAKQLVADGATSFQARVAAAGVFAAVTSGLLHWSLSDETRLADVLTETLDVVEARHG